MEAGRELDALIAREVLGRDIGDQEHNPDFFIPAYSRDISAAWQVVEKMEEQGYNFWINSVIPGSDPIVYRVKFSPIVRDYVTEFTAPLAICLAALKAKGVE